MNTPHTARYWQRAAHGERRGARFVFIAGMVAALAGANASAATFHIANGDVAALKDAIHVANSNNDHDTIILAAGGTYTLTTVDNLTEGPTGLPAILKDGNGSKILHLEGNGATLSRSTASGTPTFRFFAVDNYPSAPAVIANLTLQNGASVDSDILGAGSGGAILLNGGALTLNQCVLRDNFASLGGGAILSGSLSKLALNHCTLSDNEGRQRGGAIRNAGGSLTMSACTVVRNRSVTGPGGAIENGPSGADGTVTLTNCTISNNSANSPDSAAIFNVGYAVGAPAPGASIRIESCTFDGNGLLNSYTWTGGAPSEARMTLQNTLLNNSPIKNFSNAGNPYTEVLSEGYNLSNGDGGGLLTGTGDRINADPKLDPAGLLFNGGPTQTIALTQGSAAIDQGKAPPGQITDQRGSPRPVDNPAIAAAAGGDGSDIGAFEASADPVQYGFPSIIVTTAADHNDGVASAAYTTLREAILRANAIPGANAITFSPAVTGTITLQPAFGGQLAITEGVTITGPGARALNINANTQSRVFHVSGSGNSVITGLTLSNGWIANPAGGDSEGGGIYNHTTLALRDCTLDGNRTVGGSGGSLNGGTSRGGGIFNAGALVMERCTFKNNGASGGFGRDNPPPDDFTLTSGGAGGSAYGGAVFNGSAASLTLSNCTFAANNAGAGSGGSGHFGGNGGSGLGGAVYSLGLLDATSLTVSGNSGYGGSGGPGKFASFNGIPGIGAGGLVAVGSGTATIRNSISTGNITVGTARHDVYGTFVSGGYNLIGNNNGGSGFTGIADQTGTHAAPLNPLLAFLANNGGFTDTMRLLSGSPAIDQGRGFAVSTDQRGRGRPNDTPTIPNAAGGDGSDIGAFESGGLLIVTTLDDHSDGAATADDCTLREAIEAANAHSGEDTVIAFVPGLTGTLQLVSALPLIASGMSIIGPGADLLTVRRGNDSDYRVFHVFNNTVNGPVVTISGLTISNGRVSDAGGYPQICGAGILNVHSTLTISRCVITGNHCSGFGAGGGIFNFGGAVTLSHSTVSGNSAYSGGGIGNHQPGSGISALTINQCTLSANSTIGGDGGALHNHAVGSGAAAVVQLTNCTLSGNQGTGTFGGNGAAMINTGSSGGGGQVSLTHCTLSNNAGRGGGIYNYTLSGGAAVTLRNTLVKRAGTTPNFFNDGGLVISDGFNLSDDAAGGDGGSAPGGFLNAAGDRRNTDPLLGPLENNGGSTQTHTLLANSPALDRGKSFGASFDQRGLLRIADSLYLANAGGGDGTDIGALETHPYGSITDSNGNRLPDEWEAFYSVTDPAADPDDDGRNHLQEFHELTNPNDSSSYQLRILEIHLSGNDVVITYNGVANRTVLLERKVSLLDANWADTGVQKTPGATTVTQITHPGGKAGSTGFYRLRKVP